MGLHMQAVGRTGRLVLAHEVAQRLLTARSRINNLAHQTVGMLHRRLSEVIEDVRLAGHALEIGEELPLDPPLGGRADLVNHRDQQVDQAVGDLLLTWQTQGRDERCPHCVRVGAQLARWLGCGPLSIEVKDFREDASE
jgi:hypothetical protein